MDPRIERAKLLRAEAIRKASRCLFVDPETLINKVETMPFTPDVNGWLADNADHFTGDEAVVLVTAYRLMIETMWDVIRTEHSELPEFEERDLAC